MESREKKKVALEKQPEMDGGGSFFDRYDAKIVLAVLVMYVILLGIGTFAELFKIQSILDWWIWHP